jgi:hypothetical protein
MTWWRRTTSRPSDYDETIRELSDRTRTVIVELRRVLDDLEQGLGDDDSEDRDSTT